MNKIEPIVYYQGTKGAYSELAAKIFFGSAVKTQGLTRFEDIFLRLPENPENYGILPIENSLMGSIHKNYDLLLNNNVWIIGEVELRISYNLFMLEKKSSIKEIWAHPSVLEQCREFIAQNQNYHFVPCFDSAGAADIVKRENRTDIGIDLLKLESRPIIGKLWEYIFYIDLRGSIKDISCKNAIETLREVSIFFKFLGSYPVIKEYDYGFNCEKLQKD